MRTLLLFRGAPGVGKSTYIKENGLSQYTLSADDIRLLCQSPLMQVDGLMGISQNNEKVVWETLFKLLEVRMKRGEFTVIDATNSKTVEMNKYKKLADTYRYRIFCIDFTDVPIEVVKDRNRQREELKRVPEEVIDKMYSRFISQKIPSGITVLKPKELEKLNFPRLNLSNYKKIHHIGDIHGCYTVLKEYLKEGLKDDEFYIFLGDYIDRGLENAETLKFLLSIYNKENVVMLEGNHERHLWKWANQEKSVSREFEYVTKKQLEKEQISKKEVRCFYRKLRQCMFYEYNGRLVLVTHGGLSRLPESLVTIATDSMVNGVGNYNDIEMCDKSFLTNTEEFVYQIHGHRNPKSLETKVNERCFNLEGKIEFGGNLRCVQLNEEGFKCIELKNNIFKQIEKNDSIQTTNEDIHNIILNLRNNKYIKEKKYGVISSFNFTNKAFFDKAWDEQTIKARGLYLDTQKEKVFARSYEKFFNINEREETKFDKLEHTLKFPLTCYVKENGFLGIVSYDEYNDDLFITTKSSPDGCFADWFKDILYKKLNEEMLQKMKQHCKEKDVSFIFECVDMLNDPHVIKYKDNDLTLLDIVYNDINFKKYSYEELKYVGDKIGLKVKIKAYEILNWQDFFDWYNEVTKENYLFDDKEIEGFVIEDSNGFMTKLKLYYYNFWKHMRNVAHETLKNGYIRKTGALTTPLSNNFYMWLREKYQNQEVEYLPKNICQLRDMYYDSLKCKN